MTELTTNLQKQEQSESQVEADEFVIRLTAEGSGPPLEIRIRKFLKCALRQYRLRASWPTPAKQASEPEVVT